MNSIANEFDQMGCSALEGLQISLIASETALTHETLRLACDATFTDWQALYTNRLEDFGFAEPLAKELGITLNAMIEGGCMLALTNKSSNPCVAFRIK
ncbi:hypothetical protein AAHH67_05970 [Niallia circulans]